MVKKTHRKAAERKANGAAPAGFATSSGVAKPPPGAGAGGGAAAARRRPVSRKAKAHKDAMMERAEAAAARLETRSEKKAGRKLLRDTMKDLWKKDAKQ